MNSSTRRSALDGYADVAHVAHAAVVPKGGLQLLSLHTAQFAFECRMQAAPELPDVRALTLQGVPRVGNFWGWHIGARGRRALQPIWQALALLSHTNKHEGTDTFQS